MGRDHRYFRLRWRHSERLVRGLRTALKGRCRYMSCSWVILLQRPLLTPRGLQLRVRIRIHWRMFIKQSTLSVHGRMPPSRLSWGAAGIQTPVTSRLGGQSNM